MFTRPAAINEWKQKEREKRKRERKKREEPPKAHLRSSKERSKGRS